MNQQAESLELMIKENGTVNILGESADASPKYP